VIDDGGSLIAAAHEIGKRVSEAPGPRAMVPFRTNTLPSAAPVKFPTASRDRAVLSRAGVVYATGVVVRSGRAPELLLNSGARLRAGLYRLAISSTDAHHRRHSTSSTVSVR
jgi:hypothetical protein